MAGDVIFATHGTLAIVTLRDSECFNAMSLAMWGQLRAGFEQLAVDGTLRCVLVQGADGHFCAGGNIAQYPQFRFDEAQLRDFHEGLVWGALDAMLACDVPMLARIEGNCMGAGLEIASCCDIRVAGPSARFGAPIARLGFPMAPRELDLVLQAVGASAAREMLLEAQVIDAQRMWQLGFLNQLVDDAALSGHLDARLQRICALAPQVARMHKRMLRVLSGSGGAGQGATIAPRRAALESLVADAYAYADSAEHREGIAAFIAKRKPIF
jgi:enoyl-CoA hydratase/carnithine racemase